jgi:hypothetical protein
VSDLQDFISDMHGIRLHRRRKLNAFAHISEGPLTEMLFSVTRPAVFETHVDPHPSGHHAAKPHGTINLSKGMVDYRKEFLGIDNTPDGKS